MSEPTHPTLPDIPAACPSEPDAETVARYETANRTQIELTPTDLETLLPPGHAARLVWRFVEGLELSAFYATIKAREGRAGRPAIDPKILIALWLYATIDGVGSARELDRLCYSHDAYRWLRGGVSVNYHTLSDCRVGHEAALDDLLTQSIATLRHRGIVTLARVAEALAELSAVAAAKARTASKRKNRAPKEARVSTTDPAARVMEMPDGGYRPAYNVQFATDHDSDVIVGVAVTNTASDQQELVPMLTQLEARVGQPATLLVDGGYVAHEAIDDATARGVCVLAPVPRRKGSDEPVPVQRTDSPAVAAWRARMQTDEAKQQYRYRGAIAERINADARTHRTLGRFLVRGLPKVQACALWVALAQNLMRSMELVPHLMT